MQLIVLSTFCRRSWKLQLGVLVCRICSGMLNQANFVQRFTSKPVTPCSSVSNIICLWHKHTRAQRQKEEGTLESLKSYAVFHLTGVCLQRIGLNRISSQGFVFREFICSENLYTKTTHSPTPPNPCSLFICFVPLAMLTNFVFISCKQTPDPPKTIFCTSLALFLSIPPPPPIYNYSLFLPPANKGWNLPTPLIKLFSLLSAPPPPPDFTTEGDCPTS